MMQRPINLRGPALNLRDDIEDCAGGRPLWRKDLRSDQREPARPNRPTHARAHARARDAAIKTIALVRAGARRCSGSFPARSAAEARRNSREIRQSLFRLSGPVFRAATGRDPLGRGRTDAAKAYRPTFPPPWCPRAAFLGVGGQPKGRGRPGQT